MYFFSFLFKKSNSTHSGLIGIQVQQVQGWSGTEIFQEVQCMAKIGSPGKRE